MDCHFGVGEECSILRFLVDVRAVRRYKCEHTLKEVSEGVVGNYAEESETQHIPQQTIGLPILRTVLGLCWTRKIDIKAMKKGF